MSLTNVNRASRRFMAKVIIAEELFELEQFGDATLEARRRLEDALAYFIGADEPLPEDPPRRSLADLGPPRPAGTVVLKREPAWARALPADKNGAN